MRDKDLFKYVLLECQWLLIMNFMINISHIHTHIRTRFQRPCSCINRTTRYAMVPKLQKNSICFLPNWQTIISIFDISDWFGKSSKETENSFFPYKFVHRPSQFLVNNSYSHWLKNQSKQIDATAKYLLYFIIFVFGFLVFYQYNTFD